MAKVLKLNVDYMASTYGIDYLAAVYLELDDNGTRYLVLEGDKKDGTN